VSRTLVADRVVALLSRPLVDEQASAHLFAALGEVPLRVTDAVSDGSLPRGQALEATVRALRLQAMLRDHARQSRSNAFARVLEVVAGASRDASRGAGPADLLAVAPAALCEACGFDRAVMSRVEGSSWVPRVLHTARGGSPELADLLTGLRIPLKAGLVETEVVRRKTPALVEDADGDARTYRALVQPGGLRSYVVAPVVVGDRVVGLVHADLLDGRPLTRVDRDLTQLFAECFGRAYEQAVLAERVAAQRERLRLAFAGDGEQVEVPDPTVVRLTRAAAPTLSCVETRRDEALTSREREVLALLATGATNLHIADRLVVSESTVKWHVKRILRKLGAANRAEAAYLHLRAAGAQAHAG
jgi:DNA-binding CsgD family transcriptional regulator